MEAINSVNSINIGNVHVGINYFSRGSILKAANHHSAACPRIYVASEFAPLHTVIVAQCEFRPQDPDFMSANELAEELSILPPEEREFIRSILGRDLRVAKPDVQLRWERERQHLADLFTDLGVTVHRPAMLTELQIQHRGKAGYANHFVRDPLIVVGNNVFEASFRFPHRREEVLPCRPLIDNLIMPADCGYYAVPLPDILPMDADFGMVGPFLEGGDVLVLGKNVFVGISGRASSPRGAAYLEKVLLPQGYRVHTVTLKSNFLHLDCAMGLLREGLMLVCPDAFLEGVPEMFRDWEKILVTEEEAAQLATNGIAVSPDVYVTDPAFKRVGHEITKRGIEVHYIDLSISRSLGGGFRCSTQALHRE